MISRTSYYLILGIALATLTCAAPIDATGASESPGTLSGNVIQVPAAIPINVCGNSIDVIGLINPTFGNTCENSISDA